MLQQHNWRHLSAIFFVLMLSLPSWASNPTYTLGDEEGDVPHNAPTVTASPPLLGVVKTIPVPVDTVKLGLYGIALFSANDPAIGGLIRELTHSPDVSHVGLILWNKSYSNNPEDSKGWMSFESTGSVEEIKHLSLPKVQMNPWENVVETYDGGVSIRPLLYGKLELAPSEKAIGDFVNKYLGESYEKNVKELVESIWGGNKADNTQSLFCSELVAFMMMELGLLKKTDHSNNFLPIHFKSGYDQKLKWHDGVTCMPDQKVKDFKPVRCGRCVLL